MDKTIAPTARVSARARIGANVAIGEFTVVGDDVEIGAGARIGSHCVLGETDGGRVSGPLVIGADAVIRSHSILYAKSSFGPGLKTGHHVVIREGIVAGAGLQVGSWGDLQGNSVIGDHTRLQSHVTMGAGMVIGNFVWLFPYAILTNDPHPPSNVMLGVTIDDFVVIATHAIILPGVRLGRGSFVAAGACVGIDVPPETIAKGLPARLAGPVEGIGRHDAPGKPAYPWRGHFHRGYPAEAVERWKKGED